MKTQFSIITGLSGAGKSQALKILEDIGFFCVDNLPLSLVPRFAELCLQMGGKFNRVALGIDVRAGETSLGNLDATLAAIRKLGVQYRIFFFTANDNTLLQRYSETRRRHPLGRRVIDGIRKERRLMERVRLSADKEIDTSHLTLSELKEILAREMKVPGVKKMQVSLMSFGYKYGIPVDADIVFDVRFLPNPNYVTNLREKTGKDLAVRRYVERYRISRKFIAYLFRMLQFLLPHYVKEGKSYLTVAIGCTGGRHRSVVVAEAVARRLRKVGVLAHIHHRDIP